MIAKWPTTCWKCETAVPIGTQIKRAYKRVGFDPETRKPLWEAVPKAYVHAPKCPKVTPNQSGQVQRISLDEFRRRFPGVELDPVTGEVLSSQTKTPTLWESP